MARPSADGGFTLIEVVIAMFLLVTALMGIISTTVIVIKSNALGKTMTTATTLARDQMERLKNTAYDALAGGTDYATLSSNVQTASTADTLFTRIWTVTADGSPAAGMRTVTVTVRWNWQGVQRNVVLTTIITR